MRFWSVTPRTSGRVSVVCVGVGVCGVCVDIHMSVFSRVNVCLISYAACEYRRVVSNTLTWMNHVIHMCESRHTCVYMFTYLHIYKYIHYFSRVNALKMNMTDQSECVWVVSRMNESCRIWISHVTYKWVMSRCHIWMSCVTYEGVMSHMNESYHIWN